MRRALIKLLVATIVLTLLVLVCFSDIDGFFKAVFAPLIVVVVAPSVLLFGIDLSRAIKREAPPSRSVRTIGKVLASTQLLFGVLLIAWGIAYPAIYGIPNIVAGSSRGDTFAMPIVYTAISCLMFVVGLKYVRDGLSLLRSADHRRTDSE